MIKQISSLILALAVSATSALGEGIASQEPRLEAGGCEHFLGERYDNNLQGLIHGQKVFGEDANDFHVDEQTASDLQLDELAELFEPYLYTDMGRARLHYRFRNWQLSSSKIRLDMQIIKYIAEHPHEFDAIRDHYKQMQKSFNGFLKDFESLKQDPRANAKEKVYATLTWAVLVLPTMVSQLFPELTQVFHTVYLIGQSIAGAIFGALGLGNFKFFVTTKRNDLKKYRDAMIAAKHSAHSLAQLQDEMAKELRDHINVIYQGDVDARTRGFLRLNSYLNKEDKDLAELDKFVGDKVDFSEAGLFKLNHSLRLLEMRWSLQLPLRSRRIRVPVPNGQQFMDNTFITNGRLRNMTRMIAERKEDLAKVFSALAELEVLIAVADCYRENKEKWPISFPDEVLDPDQETELVIEDAHAPLIAAHHTQDSIGNDIRLGNRLTEKAFTMVMGQTAGGASTYQITAAQNQALAQNGFFWFARGGRFVPGIVMTAMDLTSGLGAKNYTEYEATRIATIMRMSDIYPHSYTYINNPFTSGGEVAGINLRAATLRGLVHRRTVGILATRSLGLYQEVQDNPQIDKLYAEDRHIRQFDPRTDQAGLLPDEYYNRLARYGLPDDVMEDARLNFNRMAKRYLQAPLDKTADE